MYFRNETINCPISTSETWWDMSAPLWSLQEVRVYMEWSEKVHLSLNVVSFFIEGCSSGPAKSRACRQGSMPSCQSIDCQVPTLQLRLAIMEYYGPALLAAPYLPFAFPASFDECPALLEAWWRPPPLPPFSPLPFEASGSSAASVSSSHDLIVAFFVSSFASSCLH